MERDGGADCYRRFLRGDKSGLEELLALYKRALVLFIDGYVRDFALAEDIGVDVFFEKERIHSMDASASLIFSLLAALAQDESRSISENVRWGYMQRYAQGKHRLGNNRLLGYDMDAEGKLRPNQDAWIVQMAFE